MSDLEKKTKTLRAQLKVYQALLIHINVQKQAVDKLAECLINEVLDRSDSDSDRILHMRDAKPALAKRARDILKQYGIEEDSTNFSIQIIAAEGHTFIIIERKYIDKL